MLPFVAAGVVLIPATLLLFAMLSSLRNGNAEISGRLPPGNMGMPLLGETLPFLKQQRYRRATAIGGFVEYRLARFGKIFLTNLMGRMTVCSGDAELNRFVLKNEMRLFQTHWGPCFERIMGRDSISVSVGERHKELRSIISEFLGGKRLRTQFLQVANLGASLVMSSWKEKEGSVVSATDQIAKFSLYTMAKEILSLSPQDPMIEKLRIEYDSFIRGLTALPLHIPGTTYWKGLKSRENMLKLFKGEIEKRTDNVNARREEDFLGWLMKNTDFSLERIASLLLATLFAGYDSSSRTLSLLIYFLGGCHRAIDQLREEHLQIVISKKQRGESELTWDDYKNMEFTKCVINETLRLGTPISLLPRKATKDIEFKGYLFPRGSVIFAHLDVVHLDPSQFKEPEKFNPWRWQCSSGIDMTNNLMAFGGGVRLCPGQEFARLEMAIFLHHLVLSYDWELEEPDHPVRVPYVQFPKGLPIKIIRLTSPKS